MTEFVAGYIMDHPDSSRTGATMPATSSRCSSTAPASTRVGRRRLQRRVGLSGVELVLRAVALVRPLDWGRSRNTASEADSAWARELARRMILATYDSHETGVPEDNIDGGSSSTPIGSSRPPDGPKALLGPIAWLPEVFGPSRENHIVRTRW